MTDDNNNSVMDAKEAARIYGLRWVEMFPDGDSFKGVGQLNADEVEDISSLHPKRHTLTPDGRELVDSTPIAPPIGYKRQPSLAEQMRQLIYQSQLQGNQDGPESFEDADDFEVGDDYDPSSPYEAEFDPLTPEEKAALASRGKDVEGILGPLPKPKKKVPAPVQGAGPVSPAPGAGDPQSD